MGLGKITPKWEKTIGAGAKNDTPSSHEEDDHFYSINYIFTANGYLQHTDVEWTGSRSLRYHVYLIRQGHSLVDVVAFIYRWNLKKEGHVTFTDGDGHYGVTGGASGDDKVVGDTQEQEGLFSNDDDSGFSGKRKSVRTLTLT